MNDLSSLRYLIWVSPFFLGQCRPTRSIKTTPTAHLTSCLTFPSNPTARPTAAPTAPMTVTRLSSRTTVQTPRWPNSLPAPTRAPWKRSKSGAVPTSHKPRSHSEKPRPPARPSITFPSAPTPNNRTKSSRNTTCPAPTAAAPTPRPPSTNSWRVWKPWPVPVSSRVAAVVRTVPGPRWRRSRSWKVNRSGQWCGNRRRWSSWRRPKTPAMSCERSAIPRPNRPAVRWNRVALKSFLRHQIFSSSSSPFAVLSSLLFLPGMENGKLLLQFQKRRRPPNMMGLSVFFSSLFFVRKRLVWSNVGWSLV